MISSKKCKTYPNHDVRNKKPQTQNLKILLLLNYKTFRVVKGLDSSLAQSAGKLWPSAKNDQGYLLWDFNLYPIFVF